jgi:hypothetical protein
VEATQRKTFLLMFGMTALFSVADGQTRDLSIFDVLQSFCIGRSWRYEYKLSATPGIYTDTNSVVTEFNGEQQIGMQSVYEDTLLGERYTIMGVRTIGTEVQKTKIHAVSSRLVDSTATLRVVERYKSNFRSGQHQIIGWIFPDSTYPSGPLCRGQDSTIILYPYKSYYRYYSIGGEDTFAVHKDTLILYWQRTDCLDTGVFTEHRVTQNEGVLFYRSNEFNYFDWAFDVSMTLLETTVGVEVARTDPSTFKLHQNYPNPFNPPTTISYDLPTRSHVTLKIFNVLGQEVSTLVDDDAEAGRHQVRWNADRLASGVYFYRLQAGKFIENRKMILLR